FANDLPRRLARDTAPTQIRAGTHVGRLVRIKRTASSTHGECPQSSGVTCFPGDCRGGNAKRDRPAVPSLPLDEALRRGGSSSATPALWFDPAPALQTTGCGGWPSPLRSAPQAPGAT